MIFSFLLYFAAIFSLRNNVHYMVAVCLFLAHIHVCMYFLRR
jgi:hypothetical protein